MLDELTGVLVLIAFALLIYMRMSNKNLKEVIKELKGGFNDE